jgi:UDP-glucuronate 4-epimerase
MGTVLVTGGAGFIGSHLCERLILEGNKVISFDSFNDFYSPKLKRNNIQEIIDTITIEGFDAKSFLSVEGDIRDLSLLQSLFSIHGIDTVVHLAAYAGVRPSICNPALYYDVNIVGTMNLLEVLKKYGVRKLVFASSSSVYGNNEKLPFFEDDIVDSPISPYAASKKSGELMCHVYHHLYNINTACLRFFTVYGPRQRPDLAIRKFAELILNDREIPVYGDGSTERDYTFISDIIDGIVKSIDWIQSDQSKFDIFNLGESRTISLLEMIATLEKAMGKKAKKINHPEQEGDVKKTFADIKKARNVLGYGPSTEFEEGIKVFVDWLLKSRL